MNMPSDPEFDSLLPPLQINRRGFLATTVAATGFTLASGHAIAQTAITTPDDGLLASMVAIAVGSETIPAYRAQPAGKTALATVLVIPEIFGVHEYIKDVCRRLAREGYQAIAPDLFVRQGDATAYTEIAKLRAEIIDKVPDAQVMGDLDATVRWAQANGGAPGKLAITGFCWGGRITWLYAQHSADVRAGAAWYGQLRGKTDALKPAFPIDQVAMQHAPVIGAYGAKDAGISLDDVQAMQAALKTGSQAAQASTIVVYDDAPHAFHADYRPSYREGPAREAWARMLDWFREKGVAPA